MTYDFKCKIKYKMWIP